MAKNSVVLGIAYRALRNDYDSGKEGACKDIIANEEATDEVKALAVEALQAIRGGDTNTWASKLQRIHGLVS